MKRYIKSTDSSTSDNDPGDLYGTLLQYVMSWEHKYLSAHGINDQEGAISNYQKKSGDLSYMTEVLSALKTFSEKEKDIMDKIIKFNNIKEK